MSMRIQNFMIMLLCILFLTSCMKTSTSLPDQAQADDITESQIVESEDNSDQMMEQTNGITMNSKEVNFIIKEMVLNEYFIDLDKDGIEDSVRLKVQSNISYENHLWYPHTWKNNGLLNGVEYVDVFLDVTSSETGETKSTPLERKIKMGDITECYVKEMQVIYAEDSSEPNFYICTAHIGGTRGEQKRIRFLKYYIDRNIWSEEYQEEITVLVHYLDNYTAEIMANGQIIANIDLTKIEYYGNIILFHYNEDGTVKENAQYETMDNVERTYREIEVLDNNVIAKAELFSGPVCIGKLLVNYYFENRNLLWEYSFDEE